MRLVICVSLLFSLLVPPSLLLSAPEDDDHRHVVLWQRVKRQQAGLCSPLTVFNGQVNYLPTAMGQSGTSNAGSFSAGTTAVLTCNSGFYPMGSSSASCQNSMWTPSIASCQPMTASTPFPGNPVANVNNPFFTTPPFGGAQQSFSSSSLTGQQQCLPMLMLPMGGQLFYSQQSQFGLYPSGSTVQLQCTGGNTTPSGSNMAVCQAGQWQPPQLGQCSSSGSVVGQSSLDGGCSPLPAPANGQVQYTGGQLSAFGTYPGGTSAQLTCFGGFPSSGQSFTSAVCRGGQWTPGFLGSCSGGSTPFPGSQFGGFSPTVPSLGGQLQPQGQSPCLLGMLPPLGAQIQYSTGNNGPFPSGSTASLMCGQGTVASAGQSTAVCSNGQWQPALFAGCSPSSLSPLSPSSPGSQSSGTAQCLTGLAVTNGNVVYSMGNQIGPFPQGTMATIFCQGGQMPSGGATSASCVGGQWQPNTLAQCQQGQQTAFGGFSTPWTIAPSPPSALGLSAPNSCIFGVPGPMNGRLQYSNGQLLGPFPSGTLVSMACNSGFVPTGATSALCQGGQFQPTLLGSCVQSSANPPSAPPGSLLSSLSSSSSSSSSYSPPMTSPSLTGTNWANSSYAKGNPCFEMPTPRTGRFVYSPVGFKAPFPIGSTATLVCEDGTQLPDGSSVGRSAVCLASGWSQLQFEPCSPVSTTAGAPSTTTDTSIRAGG